MLQLRKWYKLSPKDQADVKVEDVYMRVNQKSKFGNKNYFVVNCEYKSFYLTT